MKFCGYKLSLCLFIISIWGLFQLLIMGVLFYCETPAFLEDLPVGDSYVEISDYLTDVHRGYRTNAFNCIVAACLYIITLGVSGWQFYLNQKTTYQV